MGRAGRTESFGSKYAGVSVLYNEEDLKENAPGMTGEMRILLRSSSCLKAGLASYFGYLHCPSFNRCCSSKECFSRLEQEWGSGGVEEMVKLIKDKGHL